MMNELKATRGDGATTTIFDAKKIKPPKPAPAAAFNIASRKDLDQSIIYAKRIQEGMMLKEKHLHRLFPESFIFFEPRNIVSGDFYWFTRLEHKIIVIAADCTGHGIPGAFMSVLGISLLNQLVIEERQSDPSLILQRLDHKIRKAFSYSAEFAIDHHHDGMDVAVACIDETAQTISYSGAFRPLYHYAGNTLEVIPGSRYPVGGISAANERTYPVSKVSYGRGDRIFLCSDGYADQFGGPDNKKFMSSRFRQILKDTSGIPIPEQQAQVRKSFHEWMANTPQTDDVLLIGIAL